jgi:hypothetical protein
MVNCIVWGNTTKLTGSQLFSNATLNVSYCDVQAGSAGSITWGPGNLEKDPQFANVGTDDYHLKSVGGRYDPSTGLPPSNANAWVTDGVHSPGIDAGDPKSGYSVEPAPNGGRINLGFEGNTAEASKAYVPPAPALPSPEPQVAITSCPTEVKRRGTITVRWTTVMGAPAEFNRVEWWTSADPTVRSTAHDVVPPYEASLKAPARKCTVYLRVHAKVDGESLYDPKEPDPPRAVTVK